MKDAILSFSAFNLHNIPEMLMATSSLFPNFLFILALVGVLALGVNSCAAPEESKTDAAASATSTDGGSSDNGTTPSDDASLDSSNLESGVMGYSQMAITS